MYVWTVSASYCVTCTFTQWTNSLKSRAELDNVTACVPLIYITVCSVVIVTIPPTVTTADPTCHSAGSASLILVTLRRAVQVYRPLILLICEVAVRVIEPVLLSNLPSLVHLYDTVVSLSRGVTWQCNVCELPGVRTTPPSGD